MRTPVKLALLVAVAAIMCGTVSESKAQSLSLGAKAGASFSGFRGEDAGKISLRKGLAGGVFLNLSPVEFFLFSPRC